MVSFCGKYNFYSDYELTQRYEDVKTVTSASPSCEVGDDQKAGQ